MQKFEKTVLKTKRLLLRPMREGDEAIITPFANNPRIARFLTFDVPVSLEKEAVFVKKHIKRHARKGYYFIVFERKGNSFVGLIDLHGYHEQHRRAEIGLWIQEQKWRNGFGEEMCRAVFDFGFKKLRLNRIEYGVFLGNNASEGLIKKLGGFFEGTYREYFIKKGKKISSSVYSILASEWNSEKAKKGRAKK